MLHLTHMLCRILRCTIRDAGGQAPPAESENPGETPEAESFDNLTRIRGIGIVTENRLSTAGIKSYADLGRATPEKLQKILGKPRAGANFEAWIAEARDLAEKE